MTYRRHRSLSGFRRSAKPSANVSWPRLPGGAIGVSAQRIKESVLNKPADNVTLSAEAGEALIARVHQSNLSADDAGVVERVIRMYFWVVFALQEAKLSAKRLRNVLFGQGRTPKTPPAPEASSTSSDSRGEGE